MSSERFAKSFPWEESLVARDGVGIGVATSAAEDGPNGVGVEGADIQVGAEAVGGDGSEVTIIPSSSTMARVALGWGAGAYVEVDEPPKIDPTRFLHHHLFRLWHTPFNHLHLLSSSLQRVE